jgi:two-component system response regulator AtoC
MSSQDTIRLLCIDDDESFRRVLVRELRRMGLVVDAVGDAESAIVAMDTQSYEVALVDLNLPGMSGEDLIRVLKERSPSTECIVLSGHATIDNAVRTLKDGAYDFLTKPCSLEEIEAVIRKAAEKRALVRANLALTHELERRDRFHEFVGRSEALQSVLKLITKVAKTDSTVLILGESGVGKELVSRAIHCNSSRAHQPFIVVDCTALQDTLLQSELFGHERGAFTGAIARKQGLFEVANPGTIFLDEIGELSPLVQSRLLRVLDTGTFRRVGGVKDIAVNVRVVCATNRDIKRQVDESVFRKDLYYRINVVTVNVPTLQQRPEDISLLAEFFAKTSPVARGRSIGFSDEAMEALRTYAWPGNVRELQNVIERALILVEEEEIGLQDLPGNLRTELHATAADFTRDEPTLAELESRYIRHLLDTFDGHRAMVAKVLGISERNLYRKLKSLETGES